MNKKLVNRLQKAIPENGGYDLQFNPMSSGQQGKSASSLMLTVFKSSEDGKSIVHKRITIAGEGADFNAAQSAALSNALVLLGV